MNTEMKVIREFKYYNGFKSLCMRYKGYIETANKHQDYYDCLKMTWKRIRLMKRLDRRDAKF